MISRTPIRISAILITLLFLATTARESIGLGCTHHDLAAAGASHGAELANSGDHAHHHGAAADQNTEDTEACTCLGDCNGTPATPPPTAPAATFSIYIAGTTAYATESEAEPSAPTPYLIPFGTAPPLENRS